MNRPGTIDTIPQIRWRPKPVAAATVADASAQSSPLAELEPVQSGVRIKPLINPSVNGRAARVVAVVFALACVTRNMRDALFITHEFTRWFPSIPTDSLPGDPTTNVTKTDGDIPRDDNEQLNGTKEKLRVCRLDDVIDIATARFIPEKEANVVHAYANKTSCEVRQNYHANSKDTLEAQRHFASQGFRLLPETIQNGDCRLPMFNAASPFPEGAMVLLVGNSHLNQLWTSLVCRYDVVLTRRGCEACDFETYNMTNCWHNASIHGNPKFQHAVFANGAEAFFAYNTPLFYIGGVETLVEKLMGTFEWRDLGRMTHVMWGQFNSLFWASFFFNEYCPDMAWPSPESKKTNYHLSRLGNRTMPSAVDILPMLESRGFRGTLLLSKRALDANKVCGHIVSNSSIVCLDYMRRFELDEGTPFGCALDRFGHQCQPGPVDAVADWLMMVFLLTMQM